MHSTLEQTEYVEVRLVLAGMLAPPDHVAVQQIVVPHWFELGQLSPNADNCSVHFTDTTRQKASIRVLMVKLSNHEKAQLEKVYMQQRSFTMDDDPCTEGMLQSRECGCISLADLPEEVLDLVTAKLRQDNAPVSRLLAAFRGGRDSIFRTCSKISWVLKTSKKSRKPETRLLHRACCSAPAGLSVKLTHLSYPFNIHDILEPGIRAGGWSRVHSLEMDCRTGFMVVAHLGSAFPALRQLSLDLHGATLKAAALLTRLQPCSSLTHLALHNCRLADASAGPAAALLSAFPSLRSLELMQANNPMLGLAAQLTGLTSLVISVNDNTCDDASVQSIADVAAQNSQLQRLDLRFKSNYLLSDQLQHVLKSCPGMTDLGSHEAIYESEDLDFMMQHATQLTSLRGCGFDLQDTSRAGQEWPGLQQLHLRDMHEMHLEMMGRLPLKTVQSLSSAAPGGLAVFRLPLVPDPVEDVVTFLQQAASNLASWPAWQQRPEPEILLHGDGNTWAEDGELSSEHRVALLQAVAPLAGPHLKHFVFDIPEVQSFSFGQAEVEVLGRAFGSSLTHLELGSGSLKPEFWAALDTALPHLAVLSLTYDVQCSESDLTFYCSRRAAHRPLCFQFSNRDVSEPNPEHLKATLAAWGVQHITVIDM